MDNQADRQYHPANPPSAFISQTPSSPGASRITPFLPTELWVETFSHLNYKSLKRTSGTCKYFNLIITKPNAHPMLDVQLFRDKQSIGTNDVGHQRLSTYNLHPFLQTKLGFQLSNGDCGEGCVTEEDRKRCKRSGIALVKDFRYYEDIKTFAEDVHKYCNALLGGTGPFNKLTRENMTSPIINNFCFEFRFKRFRKKIYYRLSPAGKDKRDRTMFLNQILKHASLYLHGFWIHVVSVFDIGMAQQIFSTSALESVKRIREYADMGPYANFRRRSQCTSFKRRLERLREMPE